MSVRMLFECGDIQEEATVATCLIADYLMTFGLCLDLLFRISEFQFFTHVKTKREGLEGVSRIQVAKGLSFCISE